MKKTKINLFVLAAVLIALLPSKIFSQITNQPASVIAKYQPLKFTFQWKGVQQNWKYRLLPPISFVKGTNKYPVIVTLHGACGFSIPTARDYNFNNLRAVNGQLADDAVRTQYPAYVIALQADLINGKADMWSAKHLDGLKKIIATMPQADTNKIYIMGQSAGGFGTNLFISLDPNYFAAAISAGSDLSNIPADKRANLVNFNLWHMVGENDFDNNRFPGSIEFFNDMKSRGSVMKLTTFPNVAHSTEDFMVNSYNNGSGSTVVSGVSRNYNTYYASTSSDPEAITLKWLFSKSLKPVALNKTRAPQKPTINFDRANSELNYSKTETIDQIEVYNLNGTAVLKVAKPSGNSLDVSSLKSGYYIVKTYLENGDVSTAKIMK